VTRETGKTRKTIRSVRESQGMEPSELAGRTGLSEDRIHLLESLADRPSPDETSKIAAALNVPSDELVQCSETHSEPGRRTDIFTLLDAVDSNARRFISDKEIEQLAHALYLSGEAVGRIKRNR
jgi:transcriptional regulator with XRE-family HTH domain